MLADHDIDIIASYPHCSAAEVDSRRGEGVYARSLTELRLGYGTRRSLYLVHNPHDMALAGDQYALECDFRRRLTPEGTEFSGLYVLNNMPLGRFFESLVQEGKYEEYMTLLVENFNPETLAGLMCREQLSVAWDGRIYDCDFNQAEGLEPLACRTVFDFAPELWLQRTIRTAAHCFGCTAATGSSCTGSLTSVSARRRAERPVASSLKLSADSAGMDLAAIRRYYGEILKQSGDLQADAGCTVADMPLWLRRALANVHTEVLDRYYGCGLVAPFKSRHDNAAGSQGNGGAGCC